MMPCIFSQHLRTVSVCPALHGMPNFLDNSALITKLILNYSAKLNFHYSVTRNYFENLVQALEAGLEDVRATGQSTSNNTPSCKKPATEGKSGRKKVARTLSVHSDDG